MKTIIAIPARLESSRFPRKILADLCGKPVIQWVYEVAKRADISDGIYVLVDAVETENVVKSFGARAIMTSPDCYCGTARIVSIIDRIDADFIVNIQGDEPLLDPGVLVEMVERAKTNTADIITPIFRITEVEDIDNQSLSKVAVAANGRALYFSRSPIPFVRGIEKEKWLDKHRFFGHVGVYGYKRHVLENYNKLSRSELETAESLEQLRFLDNGYSIDTIIVKRPTIGIDTPDDLRRAKKSIETSQL
ncbi:MAG: 3-deoxy-manno-octulosonate cytidylyltransferase [Puniceicoccales bacterium]|jgi:3-deoxy-manno-octulosonate cytidylyltransferase (CMP-KDO synthetase)|nr:3-deoxy-manno-octulosonate cytidylyltransferase [Puniceicoccales bacterium]